MFRFIISASLTHWLTRRVAPATMAGCTRSHLFLGFVGVVFLTMWSIYQSDISQARTGTSVCVSCYASCFNVCCLSQCFVWSFAPLLVKRLGVREWISTQWLCDPLWLLLALRLTRLFFRWARWTKVLPVAFKSSHHHPKRQAGSKTASHLKQIPIKHPIVHSSSPQRRGSVGCRNWGSSCSGKCATATKRRFQRGNTV